MKKIFQFNGKTIILDTDKIESFKITNSGEILYCAITYQNGNDSLIRLGSFKKNIAKRIELLVEDLNDYLFNLFTDENAKEKNFKVFSYKEVGEDFGLGPHIYDTIFSDEKADVLIGALRI